MLGPDITDDLRLCRPYFLVPLFPDEQDEELKRARQCDLDAVRDRIKAQVEAQTAAIEKSDSKAITDIFILSHGWHRNFFGGVAAYDRIASRLGVLLRTRRFDPTRPSRIKPSQNENFHPLFLSLHWHSDPGEDEWVDKAGRRLKADFLRRVGEVFDRQPRPADPMKGEPGKPDMNRADSMENAPSDVRKKSESSAFTEDFEHLYELFSQMSAPGIDALSERVLNQNKNVQALTALLDRYVLKDDGNAPISNKAAVVWTCYHEATAKGVLVDQGEIPATHLKPLQALANFARFVVKIFGVAAVFFALRGTLSDIIGKRWEEGVSALSRSAWPSGRWLGHHRAALGAVSAFAAALAAFAFLKGAAGLQNQRARSLQKNQGKEKPARRVPFLAVASWGYLQVLFALPAVLYLLVTYPFGVLLPFFDRHLGRFRMYQERVGMRGGDKIMSTPDGDIRPFLARLAQQPLHWVRPTLARDSQVNAAVDFVDSQLAFYDMQRRGVEAGAQAAEFLGGILNDAERFPALQNARIHFLGHSFGALVAANAARHLAFQFEQGKTSRRIRSVCLLEGAIASDWFEGETILCDRLDILASIFSGYDTANGYIYPVAMHGKPAAGFVGLTPLVPNSKPESQGKFATLVRTPDFGPNPRPGQLRVLNIDASRLIYEGAVPAGGGHDDIFKDDVLYLTWAAAMLDTLDYSDGPETPLPQAAPKPDVA